MALTPNVPQSPVPLSLTQSPEICVPGPAIAPEGLEDQLRFQADELCDADSAGTYSRQWQQLADRPLEHNVFYEPWMLLPAMRHLATGKDLRVMMIFRRTASMGEGSELVGVFPLEYHHFKRSRFRVVSLWRHPHCYFCTPLVKPEGARQVLAFFLELMQQRGLLLMAFRTVSGEVGFNSALRMAIREQQWLLFSEFHSRPMLQPAQTPEEYLRDAGISGRRRRHWRRLERRLAELGRLEYSTDTSEPELWAERFLRMEAGGWKGRSGSALNSASASREFFLKMIREAHRRNRLMAISLLLEGQAIAQRLSFISGPEAFAFKSAYDERFARYSPGVLVELANLRHMHTRRDLKSMDSCTACTKNSPVNNLWSQCRAIQTVFTAPDNGVSRLLFSVLPMLRQFQAKLF